MTTPRADAGQDPRARILDAALALMSEHGSAGTSMRRLASACQLNVATLYHYFPSKAHLLQAVIAERRYGERLAGNLPPIDPAAGAYNRFTTLFNWIWEQTEAEQEVLRLIVGEGMRGEEAARSSAGALVEAVDEWLAGLMDKVFPELTGTPASGPATARLIRGQLLGLTVEKLATGEADSHPVADALARTVFGPPDDGTDSADGTDRGDPAEPA